jgi:oligopeptide/dipeptide ABC transporter ATP-binding protein
MDPLIQISNLKKCFKIGKKSLLAINNLTLEIYPGEILGLVGESGCGKSTLGRIITRLYSSNEGEIFFKGKNILTLKQKEFKELRRKIQMIFQDPYASLNPRMTVKDIIGEPLVIHKLAKGKAKKERIEELMNLVGLNPKWMGRFPHEFSGGQRQRIGIARAIAVEPEFIVCDEPISALDVSIQAQVVNLLQDLQQKMGLTLLFIAHDLAMVKHIANRVAVMYLGTIVEVASSELLYNSPLHPYTQSLLDAIPIPDPIKEKKKVHIPIKGEIPNYLNQHIGCPFAGRCPKALPICSTKTPELKEHTSKHHVSCHLY